MGLIGAGGAMGSAASEGTACASVVAAAKLMKSLRFINLSFHYLAIGQYRTTLTSADRDD